MRRQRGRNRGGVAARRRGLGDVGGADRSGSGCGDSGGVLDGGRWRHLGDDVGVRVGDNDGRLLRDGLAFRHLLRDGHVDLLGQGDGDCLRDRVLLGDGGSLSAGLRHVHGLALRHSLVGRLRAGDRLVDLSLHVLRHRVRSIRSSSSLDLRLDGRRRGPSDDDSLTLNGLGLGHRAEARQSLVDDVALGLGHCRTSGRLVDDGVKLRYVDAGGSVGLVIGATRRRLSLSHRADLRAIC